MERNKHPKANIAVSLVGFTSGQREFSMSVPASAIDGIVPEYQSEISITGVAVRQGRKIHVSYTVEANADLVCDRSLEPYQEKIIVQSDLSFALDSDLYHRQLNTEVEPDEVRGIREEATEIDLSDDVRQDLAVALPMKRVSPKYQDVPLTDIAPLPSYNNEVDERWEPLRKISERSK